MAANGLTFLKENKMSKIFYHILVIWCTSPLFFLFVYQTRINHIQEQYDYKLTKEVEELQNEYKSLQLRSEYLEFHLNKLKNKVEVFKIQEEIWKQYKIKVDRNVIAAILSVSDEFPHFPDELVFALVHKESTFKPYAMSHTAIGLGQVNYAVWKNHFTGMTKERLKTDLYFNLKVSLSILDYYYKKYDSLEKALFYYNNGESGKYKNKKYVPAVLKYKNNYQKIISKSEVENVRL